MGNCYSHSPEYSNDEIKRHLRLSKIKNPKEIKPDFENNLSDVETETEIPDIISPLLETISESYIQTLINNLNEKMNSFETTKKNKILKKTLKAMDTPFEMYFKQESIIDEETNKKRRIHNLLAKISSIFTPESSMLYELNSNEELMTRIDNNLKDYKVIRTDKSEDSNTIIQVLLMTTKKFLIVQSKSFLTMRIYRRINESEYVIVGESILRNDLKNQSDFKKIRNEISNECEILLNGSKYSDLGEGYSCFNYTQGDFKTSTGNMILKPIFKKTFNKYYTTNIKEFVNFILDDHDVNDLIWFDQDEESIQKILNTARKILLDYMTEIPDLFNKEWTNRLNELREEIENNNMDNEVQIDTVFIGNNQQQSDDEQEEKELGGNTMNDALIDEVVDTDKKQENNNENEKD